MPASWDQVLPRCVRKGAMISTQLLGLNSQDPELRISAHCTQCSQLKTQSPKLYCLAAGACMLDNIVHLQRLHTQELLLNSQH